MHRHSPKYMSVECRKRTFETSSEYNYFDDGTLPLNGTHKRPVARLCSAPWKLPGFAELDSEMRSEKGAPVVAAVTVSPSPIDHKRITISSSNECLQFRDIQLPTLLGKQLPAERSTMREQTGSNGGRRTKNKNPATLAHPKKRNTYISFDPYTPDIQTCYTYITPHLIPPIIIPATPASLSASATIILVPSVTTPAVIVPPATKVVVAPPLKKKDGCKSILGKEAREKSDIVMIAWFWGSPTSPRWAFRE
ncbi:hypothetical protein B0H13DRAFT_1873960 [Mycena leptocephala]|nr:hypothetical protein B0H13DRAFT_1873960 [Mycena leptocephala]